MVFALQVWGTASSEDFRATWGAEWGSVARWVVAITVHFEVWDTAVLFNFIRIKFCEGVMRTFQKTFCRGSAPPTLGAFIPWCRHGTAVWCVLIYFHLFFSNQKWQFCVPRAYIAQCFTSSLIRSHTDSSLSPYVQHSLPQFLLCRCNWMCLFE